MSETVETIVLIIGMLFVGLISGIGGYLLRIVDENNKQDTSKE